MRILVHIALVFSFSSYFIKKKEGKVLKLCSGGSSIRSRQGLERRSEVPQRRHEVAPAGSDVIGATGPSRSHIRCPELESRSGSDVSPRPREVARVSVAGSDVIRATRLSRSHFCLWGSRIALGATSRSDHVRSLVFSVTGND